MDDRSGSFPVRSVRPADVRRPLADCLFPAGHSAGGVGKNQGQTAFFASADVGKATDGWAKKGVCPRFF